ncbi:MAG: hypothetical protein EX263_12295 [Flavobacteriaceae bacterium]|nr:MAG: hypothetical protein EX263_12295 [Flavobacteriaceae bacterium]
MFSKTNLISTLVTALWGFLGGYLLWGLIGDPFMKDHLGTATGTIKETPDFGTLAFGCLISGFAFSTLYSKLARGSHSSSQGAQFGIWIAIFLGIGNGLIEYATANLLDLTGTITNALIYIVFFIVMGVLASLVYNKMSTKN